MRVWSSADASAGRMPGVTRRNPSPKVARIAAASRAEQTTPSSPAACARRASASARPAASGAQPSSTRSASPRLVSTVTAISRGRCGASASASRAASSIARPPDACTLTIHTPSRTAAFSACATVFGMSWNLRSRNTPNPRAASCSTSPGPAATNSSLPTLSRHAAGDSRSASASAAAADGSSSATITRGPRSAAAIADAAGPVTGTRAPRCAGGHRFPIRGRPDSASRTAAPGTRTGRTDTARPCGCAAGSGRASARAPGAVPAAPA